MVLGPCTRLGGIGQEDAVVALSCVHAPQHPSVSITMDTFAVAEDRKVLPSL